MNGQLSLPKLFNSICWIGFITQNSDIFLEQLSTQSVKHKSKPLPCERGRYVDIFEYESSQMTV